MANNDIIILPQLTIAGGDLSGSYPNPEVSGILNKSLPALPVSDGYLNYTGSAWQFSAITIPTSLPPTGTAGGDLSGTYPNPTVAAISGSTPILITPNVLEWTANTGIPTLTQANSSTTFGTNMNINPQFGTTAGGNVAGGSLVIDLQAATGTGTEADVVINRSGNFSAAIGPYGPTSGLGAIYSAIWLGPSTGTIHTGNFTMAADGSANTYLSVPDSGSIGFLVGCAAGHGVGMVSSGADAVSFNPLVDIITTSGTSTTRWSTIYGQLGLLGGTNVSGAGSSMNITAEAAFGGSNDSGGSLYLNSGAKDGTGADGYVYVRHGTTTGITLKPTNVVSIANLSTGVVHSDSTGDLTSSLVLASEISPGTSGQVLMSNATPATTWTTISGDATISATGVVKITGLDGYAITPLSDGYLFWSGTAFQWIALSLPGSITWANDLSGNSTTTNSNQYVSSLSYSSSAAGGTIAINGTGTSLQFASNNAGPLINQGNLTTNSGTASSLTIKAQNETGTTSTGGNLVLTSGTGTSVDGYVQLQVGGSTLVEAGPHGWQETVYTVTASTYTVDANQIDMVILVNYSSTGTSTITLPAPAKGRRLVIKDSSGAASNHAIAVAQHASENIENVAGSYSITENFQSIKLIADGQNWWFAP